MTLTLGLEHSEFMLKFGFTPSSQTSHIVNGLYCLGNQIDNDCDDNCFTIFSQTLVENILETSKKNCVL